MLDQCLGPISGRIAVQRVVQRARLAEAEIVLALPDDLVRRGIDQREFVADLVDPHLAGRHAVQQPGTRLVADFLDGQDRIRVAGLDHILVHGRRELQARAAFGHERRQIRLEAGLDRRARADLGADNVLRGLRVILEFRRRQALRAAASAEHQQNHRDRYCSN